MDECIFCKIVAGEIPCYKTYENDLFLGFLDINPLNPGNSLLIPKKHHRWVDDVPEFGAYWEAARALAMATRAVVNPVTITYLTLGFEVPHAHIRVIPRFENDGLFNEEAFAKMMKKISPEEMGKIARKIKEVVST